LKLKKDAVPDRAAPVGSNKPAEPFAAGRTKGENDTVEIRIQTAPGIEVEGPALAIILFESEAAVTTEAAMNAPAFEGTARQVDDASGGLIRTLYESGEFKGKALDTVVLHRVKDAGGIRAQRVLCVGGGKVERFSPTEMRRVAATAVRTLRGKRIAEIALALDAPYAGPEWVQAAVEGACVGDFEPDVHKTDPDKHSVSTFTLAVPAAGPDVMAAARAGQVIGESQNLARALANEPGNLLNPLKLAAKAQEVAAEAGLECEVLDQDRMRQLGMGALLGVSQGSAEPPALIVLRYTPDTPVANAHLGLVGKGVTFDTGGISIKPAEGMEKMRYDMAGGAATLGAMRAIGLLKPGVRVTGFIPAVENMPGSRAQRPGDIVKTLHGKTVEVINTDAEGRLILADALVYAKRLGCTHLVDAATLTGAIAIALGNVNVGAFTNHPPLWEKLSAAAGASGEKMWLMPLDEEYRELLKSAFADIANVGPRYGGAISAATFLKEFVEDTPWVHLDIAGTGWQDDNKPFAAKGPTGVATRTFARLALEWKD
jgi:leucyl aminopeptidase